MGGWLAGWLGGCAPQAHLTFVGDSITAGGSWQDAFPHLRVHNHGVPGDQASDVLARLEEVRATRARVYVLMLGINDLRSGQPPDRVAAQMGEIRQALQKSASPPARVVVVSTLQCRPEPAADPLNGCTAKVRAQVERLNQILRRQTPEEDFLDLNPAMSPGGLLSSAYTRDGIHLSAAGYRQWEALLRPKLRGSGSTGKSSAGW